MSEADEAECTKMARALYDFIDHHGDEDDKFQPVYSALDDLLYPPGGE